MKKGRKSESWWEKKKTFYFMSARNKTGTDSSETDYALPKTHSEVHTSHNQLFLSMNSIHSHNAQHERSCFLSSPACSDPFLGS